MDSCSLQSLNASEDMAGSAVEGIKRWVLVEYKKAWPARPKLENLDLTDEQRTQIADALAVEGSRMQLIRRHQSPKTIRIFLHEAGRTWMSTPQTKRLVPEEMLPYAEPMVLICTHGLRDRCCGILGGKIYIRAKRISPDLVWQASHLGGHRFAPTLLTFPQGMLYGRVAEDDVVPLLNSLSEDVPFDVDKLRGVPAWPKAAQAAAISLWKKQRLPISLHDSRESAENHWRVSLDQDGRRYHISVQKEPLPISIQASCGDEKMKPLHRFDCQILS
ncbi:MAG: sucrase ferredoxin [Myxococcota bacterium]|nr:sucrase ferredoxin [Myxococcota bacterium]